MRFHFKKLLLITMMISASLPIFARDVTVIVMDFDLDIPLEGAVIRTREGIQYISDRNGRALIEIPDNRQIIVNAAYPGYETGVLIIPVTGNTFTVFLHLAGSVMQGRELVIEAVRPDSGETRTGRSIAVSEREIAQTGEIGIIEDVMSTIRLLPGVSYTGFLNAQPSIRGGYPGDMNASLNGFYINNPFFWGSTFSIFDPRMVQSAQLSHGVFSTRYGHTISGLLDITSKNPSPTDTQYELSVNTSAANFNFSFPLSGKGGVLLMGRVTYYGPVLSLAGAVSELSEELEVFGMVKAFSTVPYIRAVTANGNYRFTNNLEFMATAFFGMDGVGVTFNNSSIVNEFLNSETTIDFLFTNYHAFFTVTLSWNPHPSMLLRFLAGTGYEEQINFGDIRYNINRPFSPNGFIINPQWSVLTNALDVEAGYSFHDSGFMDISESNLNIQGRLDYDLELTSNLLFSAGVQVMYNNFITSGIQRATNETQFRAISSQDVKDEIYNSIIENWSSLDNPLIINGLMIAMPISFPQDANNELFSSSGYILGELIIGTGINIELGLRLDHFLLTGKNNLRMDSDPVLNPRLNLDFNLYNGTGFFQKIDLSLGTGLFSSINDNVFFAEDGYNINKMKPNRSWTSVIGARFEFPELISLNIEGYYKYVFDRMYVVFDTEVGGYDIQPKFDGEGIVWGIDLMLQKIQSRYIDGWIAYSYSWAKYRDPQGSLGGMGRSGGNYGDDWYHPSFHRFHTLNFIMNIKPVQSMNFYMRLGVASGVPIVKRSEDGPQSYPVYLYKDDIFIEKYYWPSYLDGDNRTTPSLNMDIKFSIFGGNRTGKSKYEVYFAIENLLGLLYTAQGNTSFNQYTGEIDEGSMAATFDIPIPIPSFGFKISY